MRSCTINGISAKKPQERSLMVFLAHIETGSTGNLVRKLGSGNFLAQPGQTDEMLVFAELILLYLHILL